MENTDISPRSLLLLLHPSCGATSVENLLLISWNKKIQQKLLKLAPVLCWIVLLV